MALTTGDRLWHWRQWARQLAQDKDIPVSEVDWLLRWCAPSLDALALRLETYRRALSIELTLPLEDLTPLWEKRVRDRVPVQYLTGITPWRQFYLSVSPAVLIPRPETELLIDLAVQCAQANPCLQKGHWVDMGTGSGAIAIGLADVFPSATIHGVDISDDALAIARKNADIAGVGDRIHFYQGSWFEPIDHLKGCLSGLVSNPPYIPSAEIDTLQPEVTHHEPHLALDGGHDGLDSIRHLVHYAPQYLVSSGVWITEMMAGQGELVSHLLEQHPFRDIRIHYDLAGLDRFAIAYRR